MMRLLMILPDRAQGAQPQQDAHGADHARHDHRRRPRSSRWWRSATGAQSSIEDADQVGRHQHDQRRRRQLHVGRRAPGVGRVEHADGRGRRRPSARRARRAVRRRRRATRARQVIAGNQNWQTRIQGTDVDLPLIRVVADQVRARSSRRRTSPARPRSPCSASIVRRPTSSARTSTRPARSSAIKNQPFKVIGVMASKGQHGMGEDQDDSVVRALHDGAEEADGHPAHPEHHRVGGLGRRGRRRSPTRITTLLRDAPQDHAGRHRRLHGPHARGDGGDAHRGHARR